VIIIKYYALLKLPAADPGGGAVIVCANSAGSAVIVCANTIATIAAVAVNFIMVERIV
jgi:hypothetical protein